VFHGLLHIPTSGIAIEASHRVRAQGIIVLTDPDRGRRMRVNNLKQRWIRSVSYEEFHREVLQQSLYQPVLVDFWAEWCSPCLLIAPVLERIIEEYAGALWLAKVEVDAGENMKLAGHYRVRGFPTLLLLDRGEELGRFSGSRPLRYIRDFLETHGIQAAKH
jgi:putative thioredoxin